MWYVRLAYVCMSACFCVYGAATQWFYHCICTRRTRDKCVVVHCGSVTIASKYIWWIGNIRNLNIHCCALCIMCIRDYWPKVCLFVSFFVYSHSSIDGTDLYHLNERVLHSVSTHVKHVSLCYLFTISLMTIDSFKLMFIRTIFIYKMYILWTFFQSFTKIE